MQVLTPTVMLRFQIFACTERIYTWYRTNFNMSNAKNDNYNREITILLIPKFFFPEMTIF